MRKYFHTILFFLFPAVILVSQMGICGEYPPDIQRILDRGKLIVAMHKIDAPPFFMHDHKGRFYGLDVKLAKDIAKRLGVKLEFNRSADTYNEIVDVVARKEADIAISYLSKTLERSKKVLFTQPYITLNLAVIINRLAAAKKKKSISEILKNMDEKTGVLRASSHIGYVKEIFPNAKIMEYNSFEPDILNAILKGDVFAGFFDELEIKKVLRKMPELSLKLQLVILKEKQDYIAMAVPWDSFNLLYWLNCYLKTIKLNLTADRLLDQYGCIRQ